MNADRRVILGAIFGCFFSLCRANAAEVGTNFVAVIQGDVEVFHRTKAIWTAARLNESLQPGDRIRTGERSRAEVSLASGTVWKAGELSEGEIPPSPEAHFKRGIFQIFNRERQSGSIVRAPGVTAAIRGTEFIIQVQDTGDVVISMIDGLLELLDKPGTPEFRPGDQVEVVPGQPLKVDHVNATNATLIGWTLYYPGILDPLALPSLPAAQSESIHAYREGSMPEALRKLDWTLAPANDDDRCLRANLLLSVGQVARARELLASVPEQNPARQALDLLIETVLGHELSPSWLEGGNSSSKWIAISYYYQSRGKLARALEAANTSASLSPNFAFAIVRQAELEFSFDRTSRASDLATRALSLAPRNANAMTIVGFLNAARHDRTGALRAFEAAVELDSAFGTGWLGRGLAKYQLGDRVSGHRDLEIAATLEPRRGFARAYLGKSFDESADALHARRELDLAQRLDPADPTPFLYSALLHERQNEINLAIRDLERSIELNDNRSVFRSSLLLDQDRAVRGANLAAIYRDAGMEEVSVSTASGAVVSDYANHSAHLFLANSYNALRDPGLANLRYETVSFNEYLLANLLAPVGGTRLSPKVSQQEYSAFFEANRIGLTADVTGRSDGSWGESAVHHGVFDGTAYALEEDYRSIKGEQPGIHLEQTTFSGFFQQQLTLDDTLYIQAAYDRLRSGDFSLHYDPAEADKTLQFRDVQEPNIFLGLHHQWSPGSHTLLLLSSLRDRQDLTGMSAANFAAQTADGLEFNGTYPDLTATQRSALDVLGAELEQIVETPNALAVAGLRYRSADFSVSTRQNALSGHSNLYDQLFIEGREDGFSSRFKLATAYTLLQYRLFDQLTLLGGLALDRIELPVNADFPPLRSELQAKTLLHPQAGVLWSPTRAVSFRAAYAQSVSGFSLENSVRLQPAELLGFPTSFRSLNPAAPDPGSTFETIHAAADHRIGHGTYAGWRLEWLRSRGDRNSGLLTYENPFDLLTGNVGQETLNESVRYEEQAMNLYLNQLMGNDWSLGARYRLSRTKLWLHARGISGLPESFSEATLQQFSPFVVFNHPSGFFAWIDGLWTAQSDQGAHPEENFWQCNATAGWRFSRRRVELSAGVLNLTDTDYRLDPLSAYSALPRERTFYANARLNF